MKIIDEITITIKSGNGGNGKYAFNKKAYVTKIGPSGGDGGDGGNIIFVADKNLKTLSSLRFYKNIIAENGSDGDINHQKGRKGNDIFIKVPIHTKIINQKTKELITVVSGYYSNYVAMIGGKGGLGNAKLFKKGDFATNRCELGETTLPIVISLKSDLVVDIGIVGLPNAGKSSLLSKITNAKPKIANYPFTTVAPQIAIIQDKFTKQDFTIMDLPGLIVGASMGKGLGDAIFPYIDKCKILIHLIDISNKDDHDSIFAKYQLIRHELQNYHQNLATKQEIIVANKMDLPHSLENLLAFKKDLKSDNVIAISTYDQKSYQKLVNQIIFILNSLVL